jgi:hypothetical protein
MTQKAKTHDKIVLGFILLKLISDKYPNQHLRKYHPGVAIGVLYWKEIPAELHSYKNPMV